MDHCLNIIARFKNMTAHSYSNGTLIVSSREKILLIDNLDKPKPKNIQKIPWKNFQKICKIRTIDRLMRNDIRLVHQTGNGSYLACNRKGWWYINERNCLTYIPELAQTRPLARGICESKKGITYIGDYSRNTDRKDVKIYRSYKKYKFEVAYSFGEKSVRHVHAIIPDKNEKNRLWILTGDDDDESHFYYTDDDFKNIVEFLSAGQISRAADLVIKKDCLIWGTDSPIKQNYIVTINIDNTKTYKKIFSLPGPVYYSCQNASGGIYFGTTAEPGPASEKTVARIFALQQNNAVREIHNCRRDFIPQHGIIYFPSGILPENYIIFSQRGLKPYESYLTIARDEFL